MDFERSIFDPVAFTDGRGSILPRDDSGRSWRTRLRRFVSGGNPVAHAKAIEFRDRVKAMASRPAILFVGGGAVGAGTEPLYQDGTIRIVGSDVYASLHTSLLADAHQLPFCHEAFDGVWIQAVLEHVLDPPIVAAEIYRVLKPGGLVYADTPFMQQVHERAYDFMRFTLSGHRWLFRRFEQIDAGAVGGAGTAAAWSMRYLWRALGVGNKVASLLVLPFFWLRLFDRVAKRRPNADAACGVYFFGIKSDRALSPKDMIPYYDSQK